jgi:hypothetical protein
MDDDDRLDDLGGAGVVAAPGTDPGEAAYWVDTAHGNVGAHDHGDSCADRWYGGCDCGAEAALTSEIRGLLLDAGRRLVREHWRRRAERSRAGQRASDKESRLQAADWASRVLIGGSDAGWRLWQGNPPRNTGTIILPPGPIPDELDPQFYGLIEDAIGLYAIRDPRLPHKEEEAES